MTGGCLRCRPVTSPLVDVVVVGGGIVGLATAHAVTKAAPGAHVVVLEKEDHLAAHQTGRNSGVLHSGVYYRPGSMKATTVAAGRRAMLELCQEHDLPYEVCGKVIVATDEAEIPRLDELAARADANGVTAARIGSEELREIEPYAAGIAALHVPGAAIVDYGAVTRVLARMVEEAGGEVRTGAAVTGIADIGGYVRVDGPGTALRARVLVNCGGLHADRIRAMHDHRHPGMRIVPFRGEYYELTPARRGLVRARVYPVPDPAFPFLGAHFTRMLDGSVHAGPNAVLALAREGYDWKTVRVRDLGEVLASPAFWKLARQHWRTGLGEVHRSLRRAAFVRALRRLVPDVRAEDLLPAPAGVRAQALDDAGTLLDDFVIRDSGRIVDVLNAPSPAATASLEIGRIVADTALTRIVRQR